MKLLSREEFAAHRRAAQDQAIEHLLPAVTEALRHYGEEGWWRPLLAPTHSLFNETLAADSGGDVRHDVRSWARLAKQIGLTLAKTTKPGKGTAETLATWLSTAAINAAAVTAADHDPEPLVLAWVTMHDSHVRKAHKDTDGQTRPPGEPFDVDGVKMSGPGDPAAPIELWINCRCMLRPALATEAAALTDAGARSDGSSTGQDDATLPSDVVLARGDGPVWDGDQQYAQGGDMDPKQPDQGDSIGLDQPLAWHGVLAPEGVWSGDGRQFAAGALRHRDLPLPLTWQKSSQPGHDGSVTVAKIEQINRVDGQMRAQGHWLALPEADEAVGLVADFGKFGVSVDADDSEYEFDEDTEKVTFTSARIASASMVAIPAFAEAFITLGPAPEGFMGMPPEGTPSTDPADECDPNDPNYEQCMADAAKRAKAPADAPAAGADADEFGRGPGWITDPVPTKRIHDYWTVPGEPGYEKIGWGTDGDFNRCRIEIGQEIAEKDPATVAKYMNQICAQWHHDATGFWPGHAPAEVGAHHQETLTAASEKVAAEAKMAPAISLVASVGTVAKADWFKQPDLDRLTPLTITEQGRVFGHLAGWNTCHAAYPDTCVSPPRSESGYAYYLTGEVMTDEGPVAAGRITLGGGHATGNLRPNAALAHYDSTSTVVARVNCGEDEFGIWLAGDILPGTSAEVVDTLRLSPLSGDWRTDPRTGNYELIAALAVNAPGFPIPRVGVSDGRQVSLCAAGVVPPREVTEAFDLDAVAERVLAKIDQRAANKKRMTALRESVQHLLSE